MRSENQITYETRKSEESVDRKAQLEGRRSIEQSKVPVDKQVWAGREAKRRKQSTHSGAPALQAGAPVTGVGEPQGVMHAEPEAMHDSMIDEQKKRKSAESRKRKERPLPPVRRSFFDAFIENIKGLFSSRKK